MPKHVFVVMTNPLTLHHEKLGARFGPAQTPLYYTDPVQEYWTVRNSAGIIDLSHLGRLTLAGKDRVSFLNGLLTNDMTQLKEENGVHSALLNTKARVLADLYLYNQENGVLVDTGESPAEKVKGLLDQFIITEDVQIRDSTQELLQVTVQGPKSSQAFKEVLGLDLQGLTQLAYKTLGPSIIIARDRTGLGGYDIIVPRDEAEAEAVWQGFLLKGGDVGVAPVGLEALDILRLEKGLPNYGVDVDENVIVLEAGFNDAISFTKGCYMGQEVVARATHIGRVNKKLVQLEIDAKTPPGPKSKLMSDGKETGFLTSSAFSPGRGKVVGLGYVQRDIAVEGAKLTVESAGTSVPAAVARAV